MKPWVKLNRAQMGACALTAAAAFLLLWTPRGKAMAPAAPQTPLFAAAEPSAERGLPTTEAIEALFAIETLPPAPPPVIVEPPVDPAAGLRRHILVGVTMSESVAVALLFDGGRQIQVRKGDLIEGFNVAAIEPRRIEFRKDDVVVALELPAQ